jgi:nucleoside-diphosphate-sugar epimerase
MGDPDGYVDERCELKPVSLYAELKVGFERFLLDVNEPGFCGVCLRFATAYGLSARMRFDLTVNEFTRELFLGRKLEVYGEQFWRPYCHVYDLARACVGALEADTDRVSGQAFNVGDTAENYRKRELVELILRQLPEQKDKVSFVRRDNDRRNYRVNFDKIASSLGFSVSKKVPDGIREIIQALGSGFIRNPDDEFFINK